MFSEEVQEFLKNKKDYTEDQLWGVHSLYMLLCLDIEDFCKIIDAVGLEPLLKKEAYYDLLFQCFLDNTKSDW